MMSPEVLTVTPHWLVLNKPSGWLTIPGRQSLDATPLPVLSEWVQERQKARVWVVHRLDRDTSGVILFALNEQAHVRANAWFMSRQVKKTYECLASGRASAPMMKLADSIEGASCLTQVEVSENFARGFLGKVSPLTGRRHQIRIHLSRAGHPLWGDTQYGGPTEIGSECTVGRVALHARRLELPPEFGTDRIFTAERPADFCYWLECLRNNK